MTYWIVLAAGCSIFLVWFALLAPLWPALHGRWLRKRTANLTPLEEWPLVSVIVPARDEGEKIEAGLRSLLASDYPRLEIIAVDDRSTDQTGAVMDRFAAEDARLRVIHIRELPEGWLGKNHAMHVAAQDARGDLLLFTDGDVIYQSETVQLSVLYVEHGKLDHLTMLCEFIPGSFWENAAVAYFGLVYFAAVKPWLIPTPYKNAYAGVGAFNMVRRSAYEKIDGHVPIRLDVLDDVQLGKLIKAHSLRSDLLASGPLLSVRWQNSLWGTITGLEKNGFAAFGYSLLFLGFATLFVLAVTFIPYVAVFAVRNALVIPFALSLALMHATHAAVGYRFGSGWKVTFLLPWATLVLLFAYWRSAVITLKQGGVRWRDTFYPLKLLRTNRWRG